MSVTLRMEQSVLLLIALGGVSNNAFEVHHLALVLVENVSIREKRESTLVG